MLWLWIGPHTVLKTGTEYPLTHNSILLSLLAATKALAHYHVFILAPSLTQVLSYPQSDVHKSIRLSIHLGEGVVVPWVPQQTKTTNIRALVNEQ